MHRLLVARLPLSRSFFLPIAAVQTVVGSDAAIFLPAELSAWLTPTEVARRAAVAHGGFRLRSRHRFLSVGATSRKEQVSMEGEGIEHEKSEDILKKDQHPLSRDDFMSVSYGEGYSTRSGDDGFGQVYGKSGKAVRDRKLARDTEEDDDEDDIIGLDPKKCHEFDRTQGSPVAQKEAARHSDHGNAFEDEAAALRRKDAEIARRRASGAAI